MPYEVKYYTKITIELGEAFRGTGTLFFFPEGRTYSPPAKQAVVSLPLVGHGALRGDFRFLRKAMDDAGQAPIVHAASKG